MILDPEKEPERWDEPILTYNTRQAKKSVKNEPISTELN
jgi:hypothetical protein